jgi:hypothetical protein
VLAVVAAVGLRNRMLGWVVAAAVLLLLRG